MKLLICPKCNDVFKLDKEELRSCKCGHVKGKYKEDGHCAVTNGNGINLAMNSNDLMLKMIYLSSEEDGELKYDEYRDKYKIETWVRPSSGKANPRSKIDPNL